jgi:hypothetical protein
MKPINTLCGQNAEVPIFKTDSALLKRSFKGVMESFIMNANLKNDLGIYVLKDGPIMARNVRHSCTVPQ